MAKSDVVDKLGNQINIMKYYVMFSNIIIWMIAACVFGLCMWLRLEGGLGEWIVKLELQNFYIGTYLLIAAAIIMMISSFLGCFSVLNEGSMMLFLFIGSQILCFVLGLSGSAVILDYSTQDSRLQPRIRESMRRLIMNAHHEESRQTLAMIQENIGCCGADGPVDYTSLHQNLPNQCRDTVTGNPFFHGCVDELTWFFEEKTMWITGLAMVLCFMHVINAVVTIIIKQGIDKENNQSTTYRN